MATNKNQHYVPRCYLRAFTVDAENKAINLFNLEREQFITGAPVKNQCSRDYFYGKDEKLEKALQFTEGVYAMIVREIQSPGYSLTDDHRAALLKFWLLQHMRTEAAAKVSVSIANAIRKTAIVASMAQESDFDIGLTIREAVNIAMRNFVECIHYVDDLRACLVRNYSGMPFFASDDPAVLTNRWHFGDKRTRLTGFGTGSAGALLLLPLTPDLLLLGYDGAVYSVPHKKRWVSLRRKADAYALNAHQVLNAFANLYVREAAQEELVRDTTSEFAPLRPEQKFQINFAVLEEDDDYEERYRAVSPEEAGRYEKALVHQTAIRVDPGRWPSFLGWRRRGSVYFHRHNQSHCVRRAHVDPDTFWEYRKERSR